MKFFHTTQKKKICSALGGLCVQSRTLTHLSLFSPKGPGSASLPAGLNESAGKTVQRAKMPPHNVQLSLLWLGDRPLGDSAHRKNLLIQFQKLPASPYLH